MYDVIALGELLVDLAERTKDENGYPTLAANPGGAPGNFLAALSAYGKKTAFLAQVGDDTFGHLLTGTMRRAGIDTRGILISPDTFTTLAFVTFDAHGDRSFAFARKPGADTQLRWEEIDPAMLEQARTLLAAALLAQYGQSPEGPDAALIVQLGKRLTKQRIMGTIELLQTYRGACSYNVGASHVLGALAVELEEIL